MFVFSCNLPQLEANPEIANWAPNKVEEMRAKRYEDPWPCVRVCVRTRVCVLASVLGRRRGGGIRSGSGCRAWGSVGSVMPTLMDVYNMIQRYMLLHSIVWAVPLCRYFLVRATIASACGFIPFVGWIIGPSRMFVLPCSQPLLPFSLAWVC